MFRLAGFALAVSLAACAVEPELAQTSSASTVADYVNSTGCTTAVVIGLSKQIAEEAGCENPASFVSFDGAPGITLASNAVLPYLVKDARDDLEIVAASNSLDLTSALRTIAQQYLLYQWYQQGRCGITAAATVGNSNHEGGRAVDLSNYSASISAMAAQGWAHDVANDVVHFDHTASPDDRGQDVQAFQTLWNRNNPGDVIATDGAYGPQTEARLVQSPATGFAMGASCATPHVDIVGIDGPDVAPPLTHVEYAITLLNAAGVDWSPQTQLAIAGANASVLYDPSWISQTVVLTVGQAVANNTQVTIDVGVTTPAVDVATPIAQSFVLSDSGATLATISLALTVDPNAGSGSGGGGGGGSGGSGGSGGCDAGGGGSGAGALMLGVLATALLRRRR